MTLAAPDKATSAGGDAGAAAAAGTGGPALRSVHTTSFPPILDRLRVSLAVTTYQAGKLVLLRPDAGDVLNTHFRTFPKPMGLAFAGGRLAVGTAAEIWEFHDCPAVAPRLDAAAAAAASAQKAAGKNGDAAGIASHDFAPPAAPGPRHDACFLPRWAHVTGDVQIHEMAWAGGGIRPADDAPGAAPADLWFVNTRFSCLCTRNAPGDAAGVPSRYSFVPRWRPPFVSALAGEDRCHLNGLAVRDGRPRYVTALGATDTPGGWRADKRAGGILMDVRSNEVLARGLSMPHSPRWHQGRLWVLNSGDGGVGYVDLDTGTYQEVVRLPGFTRGLDFAGPYAFVGLSQVRESAVFSGIAIADRPQAERKCGVWAIDLRTGRVVAFVEFQDAVQEVFAVQVLPGLRWPDVINDDRDTIANAFVLPDDALAAASVAARPVPRP